MADKLTQQITDALTKAAAHPRGLPLYAGKSEPGLFPATAAGKTASQKALADGYLRVLGVDPHAKQSRDHYGLTDAGWNCLLDRVNPKQVLEDFVRVLETRSGEVEELLALARGMADHLQGLKEAVTRVLPSVREGRIAWQESRAESSTTNGVPKNRIACVDAPHEEPKPFVAVETAPADVRETSSTTQVPDLAATVLERLRDWPSAAGEDCPLPKLYRVLATGASPPSIGAFHDILRRLHTEGAIYLHPWTGPLYAMPEPAYALLAGHNVAYYASIRM